MRSNCHLEAWKRYRRGEAVGFCFLPTQYSTTAALTRHPLWCPLKIVGIALQWASWPLTHLGEFLRTGHWYHVHWIDRDGVAWEFVMVGPDGADARTHTAMPPLLFRGRVRRVGDE
jgi:hypothetical protein